MSLNYWMEAREIDAPMLAARSRVSLVQTKRYIDKIDAIPEKVLEVFAKVLKCLPDDIRTSNPNHTWICANCGVSQSRHNENSWCYVGRNGDRPLKTTPIEWADSNHSKCTFCAKAKRHYCHRCY